MNRDEFDREMAESGREITAGFAAAAASVGLGAGPVAATFVGAGGPVLVFLDKAARRWQERRQGNAAQVVERAAAILDEGLDIFEERSSGYDARLELLARIVEAGARTSLDAKITALARVLAYGFSEDEAADEALVLAAALADVEAPHVVLLRHLAENRQPPEETWRKGDPPKGWEVSQLAQVLPKLAGVLDGLVAVLAGHGLIRSQGDGTWSGIGAASQFAVTPLGMRCLMLLGVGFDE